MEEFLKSASSLTLALYLLGIKQVRNAVTSQEDARMRTPAEALDSLTNAAVNQFGETMRATFKALDHIQRGAIAFAFANLQWNGEEPQTAPEVREVQCFEVVVEPHAPVRHHNHVRTATVVIESESVM